MVWLISVHIFCNPQLNICTLILLGQFSSPTSCWKNTGRSRFYFKKPDYSETQCKAPIFFKRPFYWTHNEEVSMNSTKELFWKSAQLNLFNISLNTTRVNREFKTNRIKEKQPYVDFLSYIMTNPLRHFQLFKYSSWKLSICCTKAKQKKKTKSFLM